MLCAIWSFAAQAIYWGAEQHGHMEAVGYDLYCKLLNEAVLALKGQKEDEGFETVVDCDIDAYIPASYIKK